MRTGGRDESGAAAASPGGPRSPRWPHRARLVHVAAVPLFHGPQVRILLLQAVLQLLDTPGCWGNRVTPSAPSRAWGPPTHAAAESHSLLLSAGGSSSSMYSRFRCSSRSASCSFCLGTEEGEPQADVQAPFPSSHRWPQPSRLANTRLPGRRDLSVCPGPTVSLATEVISFHTPNPVAPGPAPHVPNSLHGPPTGTGAFTPCQPLLHSAHSFLHPAASDLSSTQISSNKKKLQGKKTTVLLPAAKPQESDNAPCR